MKRELTTISGLLGAILLISACEGGQGDVTLQSGVRAAERQEVFEGPVPKAACGPNDATETGLQGQVPLIDRVSGRSLSAYNCNLELVSEIPGEGSAWQFAWYEDCAYYSTASLDTVYTKPGQLEPGVVVVDGSDSSAPTVTARLTTQSMLDPWESLKVNENRQLLGAVDGVNGGIIGGSSYFDLYSIAGDCTRPELLFSGPIGTDNGHAGNFAPDGLTYYAASASGNGVRAIDVSDPGAPSLFAGTDVFPATTHDLSASEDGTRAYFTERATGLVILDVSDIQNRVPGPEVHVIGEYVRTDGSTAQMTQPMTIGGKPYILFVDEMGKGAARIIDISDETNPVVTAKLKLEVHMPENADEVSRDAAGLFVYEGHYCTASDGKTHTGTNTVYDAVIAVCGYFQSGLRVFDIRDPYAPREIAYYIPPARPGYLPGSNYELVGASQTAPYASSHPRYRPDRNEIWFASQERGFQVVRLTRPLSELLGDS